MSQRGFTLVESVCALAVLAITLLGVVPAMQTMMDSNTFSEQRSYAVAAAQQAMEALREQSPTSLPSSGSSAAQSVYVGTHEFEVVAHYCSDSSFCDADTRHILLEVFYAGQPAYSVATVYTELQ